MLQTERFSTLYTDEQRVGWHGQRDKNLKDEVTAAMAGNGTF